MAVDGDHIRVAVILREKVGGVGEQPGSWEQGRQKPSSGLRTRAGGLGHQGDGSAALLAQVEFCSCGRRDRGPGTRTEVRVGDTWTGAARGWLGDKVGMAYLTLHLKLCIIGCISGTDFGSVLGNLQM